MNEKLLEHKIDDLHKDIRELKEIGLKTNGRVGSLERWRSYLTGAISVIILLVIPIVIQYVSRIVQAYLMN